jgi:hypothetical protein
MIKEDIYTIIGDDELVNDFEFGIRMFRAIHTEDVSSHATRKCLIYSGAL